MDPRSYLAGFAAGTQISGRSMFKVDTIAHCETFLATDRQGSDRLQDFRFKYLARQSKPTENSMINYYLFGARPINSTGALDQEVIERLKQEVKAWLPLGTRAVIVKSYYGWIDGRTNEELTSDQFHQLINNLEDRFPTEQKDQSWNQFCTNLSEWLKRNRGLDQIYVPVIVYGVWLFTNEAFLKGLQRGIAHRTDQSADSILGVPFGKND